MCKRVDWRYEMEGNGLTAVSSLVGSDSGPSLLCISLPSRSKRRARR